MSSYLSALSSVLMLLSLTLGFQQPVLSIEMDEPVEDSIESTTKPDAFDDIDYHWSRHIINWLAGDNPEKISYLKTEGESFRPGCPITRGEWVKMSMTILDLQNRPDANPSRVANTPKCSDFPNQPCPFSDIPATESSQSSEHPSDYQATFHAYRTGMISGYKDGTFRPLQSLNRAEAVASLANGLNLVAQLDTLKQESGEDPSMSVSNYFMNGIAFENEWFADALHAALLANLVALDWSLEFYSIDPLNRGEAAVMMYLSLVHQGKASLDDPILKQEAFPGEYALRHIRKGGELSFSFAPPAYERQCNN